MDLLKCEPCLKLYQTKQELACHVFDHHEQIKTFPCSACSLVFASEEHLTTHQSLQHTQISKRGVNISTSEKVYENANKYLLESANHEKIRKFACEQCNYKCSRKTRLTLFKKIKNKIDFIYLKIKTR